jgi:hypothetical protein
VVRAGVERDRSFGKRTYMPDGPPGVRMSGNGTTEIEGMVRGVDEEIDELADAVAADVADLLDVRTEHVSSRFGYDHRTREDRDRPHRRRPRREPPRALRRYQARR